MKGKLVQKCIVLTAALSMLSMGIVANADESYTVQSGDNLSKIAKTSYGDSTQWKTIYEANKDSIKKPDLIYKGQVLTLPGVAEAAPAVENPAPEAVITETETPEAVETEVPEAVPEEHQESVEAADANAVDQTAGIHSYEDAEAIWSNFWSGDYLSYFDDETLGFFDENDDYVISLEEVQNLSNWVLYGNDTNMDNNTPEGPLDEQEAIAVATHIVNRDIPVPDRLFKVVYVDGIWIKGL